MTQVINFKTTYKPDGTPVDWVLLAPRGETQQSTQTWHRVAKLMPPEDPSRELEDSPTFQAMKARWENVVGPAYEAYSKGNEIPVSGIPLAAWSAVSAEQAGILKGLGIRTVEDVAEMSDGMIQKAPLPNMRELKGMARKYLDSQDIVDTQSKLEEAEKRIAVMEEMLAEQQPKRRGRPPKVKPESDAA